ncbi:B12-binding domain-containing radical SAM protein [Mesorhizobium sp. CA14]|uniref:B12-binding domain-containing radical SAM protein n=1 Tax=Mesorhizobium sp. CA14 TaxID=2876642 RepID=UPI001CCB5033|nr:radical SAM protein [Mesorhizobium sp. CA14]MBZ9850003.1 B12-binding domain-containing radical SAM protein [Mesorhizobium sp. CA14]
MRVVFVDNLLIPSGDLSSFDAQPHLGLISLSAIVRQNGHEPLIVDPKYLVKSKAMRLDGSLYKNMAQYIRDLQPDVVGFTSLGCSFIFTLKVAHYLKAQLPKLPIILGGPHATILGEQILSRFPQFDLVVRHEGEAVISQVIDGLGAGSFDGLPGVVWRKNEDVVSNKGAPSVVELDSLPSPAYDLCPVVNAGVRRLRVEAGRGCPFNCTFCSTAEFFGRQYRLKSPAVLVSELRRLKDTYDISCFSLTHDLFTVNRKKVMSFCEAVSDLDVKWGCSARIDCVDADLLKEMATAGCDMIYYGIETGADVVQRTSKKRLDLHLLMPTLAESIRLGISPTASFIIGFPEEEDEGQNATIDLIGECILCFGDDVTVQLHMLTPEPGTELYRLMGGDVRRDWFQTDFNAVLLEDDDESIVSHNPDIFCTYYYYPSVGSRERAKAAVQVVFLLGQLGSGVARMALGRFDGRLSKLVEEFVLWGSDRLDWNSVSETDLIEFIRCRFGERDVLLSAFRLNSVGITMLRKRREQVFLSEVPLQSPVALPEGVALLRACHNPVKVAEALASACVPKESYGELSDWLVRTKERDGVQVDVFAVNPTWATILASLQSSISFSEFSCLFRDAGMGTTVLEGMFTLRELGLLEFDSLLASRALSGNAGA